MERSRPSAPYCRRSQLRLTRRRHHSRSCPPRRFRQSRTCHRCQIYRPFRSHLQPRSKFRRPPRRHCRCPLHREPRVHPLRHHWSGWNLRCLRQHHRHRLHPTGLRCPHPIPRARTFRQTRCCQPSLHCHRYRQSLPCHPIPLPHRCRRLHWFVRQMIQCHGSAAPARIRR